VIALDGRAHLGQGEAVAYDLRREMGSADAICGVIGLCGLNMPKS
jgi:hypothetical protein